MKKHNFFSILKTKFYSFLYRTFKKPIYDYLKKRIEIKKRNELIKVFEKAFNVDYKQVLLLMDEKNWKNAYRLDERLVKELQELRMQHNKIIDKSPNFYDVDAVEIHNTMGRMNNTKTIYKIIDEEKNYDKLLLKKQLNLVNKPNKYQQSKNSSKDDVKMEDKNVDYLLTQLRKLNKETLSEEKEAIPNKKLIDILNNKRKK